MGKSDFLMLFCQAALAAATALVARRFRRASPISMRGVEPEVVDTDGPQLQSQCMQNVWVDVAVTWEIYL